MQPTGKYDFTVKWNPQSDAVSQFDLLVPELPVILTVILRSVYNSAGTISL